METAKRKMMPRWLRYLGLPIVVFFAGPLAYFLSDFCLRPLHLKPSNWDSPPAVVSYLYSFLGPFLAGLGWSFFAPIPRFAAAIWTVSLYAAPCCVCTSFDFESPPREVVNIMLYWLFAGCLTPVVTFVILDYKENREWYHGAINEFEAWWKNAKI